MNEAPVPTVGWSPRVDLVAIACLCLLIGAIYAPVRGFEFLTWDDFPYVIENPKVMAGITRDSLVWAMTAIHMNNWHPLTWLSHMLDVELFGAWAGGHHLVNVVGHCINAAMLYLLLRRWSGGVMPSLIVAALFAVHPMHVESVAWVAERKDVLSAFFWLLTLHCYASYVARPGPLRYAAVTVAFALGLMAKPMLVTLPVILLLLDFWPHRRWIPGAGLAGTAAALWPLLREKLVWLALAAASVVITLFAQGEAMMPSELVGAGLRLGNALRAVAAYVWLTVWPLDLSYFYPIYPIKPWQWLASLTVFVAGAVWAWRGRVTSPWRVVGLLWFLVALTPVIGVIKVGAQAYADRYVYLPHIGLFVAGVWSITAWARASRKRQRFCVALAAATVLALAAVAVRQVMVWRDSETLYRHALRLDPKNFFAEMMLTETYLILGPREQGEAMAARIVAASPGAAAGLTRLAFDAINAGKFDEALARCRAVLSVQPGYAPAHLATGLALQGRGEWLPAIDALRRAVAADPSSSVAWVALSRLLARTGQAEAAAEATARARALPPPRSGR